MRDTSPAYLVASLFLGLAGPGPAADNPPVVIPAPGTPAKVELKEVEPPPGAVARKPREAAPGSGAAVLTPGHFRMYFLTNAAKATDVQWAVREFDLPDAEMGKEKIVRTRTIPAGTPVFGRYEGDGTDEFHEFKTATGTMLGVYVAQGPDGKYGAGRIEVVGTVVVDGKMQVVRQRIDANLGAAPPPDGGKKDDNVRPPVAAGRRQIVIVEETEAAASNRAAQFADPDLQARVRDKGHIWRCVDQNVKQYDPQTKTYVTPPDLATYLADAKTKKMPYGYILVPGTPKPLYSGTIPAGATGADILKLLIDNGG